MKLECAAVLFDMDGTLVDSTAVVERAWAGWAARHGIPLADVLTFSHGRRTADTLAHFRPEVDYSIELAELEDYEETVTDGIIAVKGAEAAVIAAQAGAWGVVTSAPRQLAEIRLTIAGLPLPQVLVTADRIGRGKPHPEGFLRAAEELGVAPAECLVFEDTAPGIEAGVRAGMQVVGLLTTVPRKQLGCEWIINDFRDVHLQKRDSGFEIFLRLASPEQLL